MASHSISFNINTLYPYSVSIISTSCSRGGVPGSYRYIRIQKQSGLQKRMTVRRGVSGKRDKGSRSRGLANMKVYEGHPIIAQCRCKPAKKVKIGLASLEAGVKASRPSGCRAHHRTTFLPCIDIGFVCGYSTSPPPSLRSFLRSPMLGLGRDVLERETFCAQSSGLIDETTAHFQIFPARLPEERKQPDRDSTNKIICSSSIGYSLDFASTVERLSFVSLSRFSPFQTNLQNNP